MRFLNAILVIVVLSSTMSLVARADDDKPPPIKTHTEENLGWHFYYEEEKEKETEVPKVEPPKATPAPSTPTKKSEPPFSVSWFKANFETIQNNAINNPTDSNAMRALLYAERVMADKSEVFAREKVEMASIDPYLQEGVRIPLAGAAKNAWVLDKKSNRELALEHISQKVGIAFFHDMSCRFCEQMVPVINYLHETNSFEIRVFLKNATRAYIPRLSSGIPIVMDSGHSQTFGVKQWPAVALLEPPKRVSIVSYGATTYEQLSSRILNVSLEQNILEEEWYLKVNPERKGLITPEQLSALSSGLGSAMSDDPVKMINAVMEMIDDSSHTPMEGDTNEH